MAGFHKKFRPRVQREPGWPKNIATTSDDFFSLGTTLCPQCIFSLLLQETCTVHAWTEDEISCFAPQVDSLKAGL